MIFLIMVRKDVSNTDLAVHCFLLLSICTLTALKGPGPSGAVHGFGPLNTYPIHIQVELLCWGEIKILGMKEDYTQISTVFGQTIVWKIAGRVNIWSLSC